MINLVTGLPGSGKTLWTLKRVEELRLKENRKVYYHGIPDLALDWELLESPEHWTKLPSNSIIVIDECQSTFRPRPATVKPPEYIAGFETHRHKGLDFFLLTQHPMLVDSAIRRLAGKHFHVVRFYGFQKSTIHEFQQVRDNVDKSLKNSIATHFAFPKDVFNWYKSADAHTMKKRIPMRMIFLVLSPFLLAAVLYMLYLNVWKLKEDPKKSMDNIAHPLPVDSNGNIVTNQPKNQLYQEDTKLTYVSSHTPEVSNFAFTAPAYQEVIKPVVAPYPAACLTSKSKGCKCYSQQGTVLPVSLDVCKQVVANGFFLEWDVSKNDNNTNAQKNAAPVNDNTSNSQPFVITPQTLGINTKSSPLNS